MLNKRQKLGKVGEDATVAFLIQKKIKIIERNYRAKTGEIDIIAEDNGVIVFVEVKTRNTMKFGDPRESVTYKKQKKISMTALTYLKSAGKINKKARFDVASVKMENGKPIIKIVENAFNLTYG